MSDHLATARATLLATLDQLKSAIPLKTMQVICGLREDKQ